MIRVSYLCDSVSYHYSLNLYYTVHVNLFSKAKWLQYEPWHEISNNMVCATSEGSDQPAHKRSLIRAFASRTNIL